MLDIAKCNHKDCKKSNECYRFLTKSNNYQSYADFKEICRSPTFKWFCPTNNKRIRKEG